jgi:hypothetical protein
MKTTEFLRVLATDIDRYGPRPVKAALIDKRGAIRHGYEVVSGNVWTEQRGGYQGPEDFIVLFEKEADHE